MSKQNMSRWIIQIPNSSRQGHHNQTLHLFHQMQQSPYFQLSPFIIPSIIKSCASLSNLKAGKAVHNQIVRSLVHVDPFISSALIDLYHKCGKLEHARNVFDTIPERDLVVWNSIVSGYTHFRLAEHALVLAVKMRLCGLKPDLYTWNALISGFSLLGDDEMALDLFRLMQNEEVVPDAFSWTSIISGLVRNFKYDKGLGLFRRMVLFARVRPSSVTISSILPVCANVMDLKRGREIHGYAIAIGVEKDPFVSSSLIDMYAKCGYILEAEKIFQKMTERTLVSWNSMIFGYSNHGYCERAIQLFYQMQAEGVMKDHLTFTAIFTACSHSGMIELGKRMFESMRDEYRIEPRLEHYACMVDLLGRAGRVSEAYEFVRVMPVEPDSFVWGALLGACQKHRNVELAEVAASHLIKLEPGSSGSSVLLSNVLMDSGRWGDALKNDRLMRKKKLKRYSGCSWIQDVSWPNNWASHRGLSKIFL